MRNSKSESSLNFNLIMPAVLLMIFLIVPFSINSFMHLMSPKRELNPIVMNLPLDSTAILIPSRIKQYESFEVTLNLETKPLSRFLNEIISTASEGTSIQGITGLVSPYMKAEIVGEDFQIDRVGPQESMSNYEGTSRWQWHVNAESSGSRILKFQLHLLTYHAGQQAEEILDLGEARFSVQASPLEWFKRNGFWISSLLLVSIGLILLLRWRCYG